MRHKPTILISFDVEEFDTPLRHGISIPKEKQLEIGYEGLLAVWSLIESCQPMPCTFYTTAYFALRYPDLIKKIATSHEIGSHTFYHSTFQPNDILESKNTLESIIQKPVYGFRMPNMQTFEPALIQQAGYVYDSSINPTWIPGKYNYFFKSTKPYYTPYFLEVPASVVPLWRIPLFWLTFKNFPFALYWRLCKHTLRRTGILHLYFHPWEFADLSSFKISSYIIQPHGSVLIERLHRLVTKLKQLDDVHFSTTIDFVNQHYPQHNG